jgi:hypothetical protein
MKNIFSLEVCNELINRIENLTPETQAAWGKMSVDQMLAHCNVTYEMAFENKHPKAKGFLKFILKTFIKPMVINEKPYKKNGKTAPAFVISNHKNFELEKNRLISYIKQAQELGETYFDGKESNSFGVLNSKEWNNMFYKHLNHHLSQFGV